MFVCVHAYVCTGVCLGHVEWLGLCQVSTGSSVGMWAESLWCGQGGGLEYIWGMRRLVSSEKGGRHGGLMEAYVIIIGWVWVSWGGWGSLGEKSWAQVRQDGP